MSDYVGLLGATKQHSLYEKNQDMTNHRLTADRRCETESKEAHALKNAPNHTVLYMKGLTSPVWTLDMFQMVTGDSCPCMKRTKESTACDITVRHATYTVSGCGFVVRYQNTSNLENHYVTTGTDHNELADVVPDFTTDKKACVTSSLSSGLFERIGLYPCPRTTTNSTTS